MVIAVPHQPIVGVKIDEQGAFTARPQDVLAPGDFSAETLLGDRQRRRNAVYQQVFATPPAADAPAIPVLYAWTDAVDSGFIFPQSRQLARRCCRFPFDCSHRPPARRWLSPPRFFPIGRWAIRAASRRRPMPISCTVGWKANWR